MAKKKKNTPHTPDTQATTNATPGEDPTLDETVSDNTAQVPEVAEEPKPVEPNVEPTPVSPETTVEPASGPLTSHTGVQLVETPHTTRLDDPRDSIIRTLAVSLGFVSFLALGLGIGLIFLARSISQTNVATPAATSSDTPAENPDPIFSASAIRVNPKASKDAIIVELHVDYHCGWCQRADTIYGQALHELSAEGKIDLRVHIHTFVKEDSSNRAGVASACAHQVGKFLDYHEVIFANQQLGSQGGYSDNLLRTDFANMAGITGTDLMKFQKCYDDRATQSTIDAMNAESPEMGITGTPAFLINGVKASFDLQPDDEYPQPISASDLYEGLVNVIGG
ncbi:MAG: DsbA family protein [Propionibacteriaceae bacterium]|nr:DsbA family protein [Propionibacteriaceae bacterium]